MLAYPANPHVLKMKIRSRPPPPAPESGACSDVKCHVRFSDAATPRASSAGDASTVGGASPRDPEGSGGAAMTLSGLGGAVSLSKRAAPSKVAAAGERNSVMVEENT